MCKGEVIKPLSSLFSLLLNSVVSIAQTEPVHHVSFIRKFSNLEDTNYTKQSSAGNTVIKKLLQSLFKQKSKHRILNGKNNITA